MDKRSLRRENFARLRELSSAEKSESSAAIVSHLAQEPAFLKAKTVFSYAAMKSEPDLAALREQFPEKTWALSRVADDGESLHFHEVKPGIALVESELGFLEPDPAICPVITAPDLVLVPGVGFDGESKARLGRGKGHYDRYLGPLVASDRAPVLLGICFSVQEVPLTPEPHDVPMTQIVTEKGFA